MAKSIEQAKRYAKIEAPNGYKFDLQNYLYNPARDNEYPAFYKVIADDEEKITIRKVYFFRYYDKSAAVYVETYSRMKNGGQWQVVNRNPGYSEKIVEQLPAGTRYSPKLLFPYCV